MSSTAAVAVHGAHAEHHELGFVRTYLFSTDHKMIAKQFLFMALFMMAVGGLMAMLMRLELAWPETQFSFLRVLPETLQQDNAITPNTYNSMFTMHATIMIFFVVMPILVGTFGNLLIPLMIGARDMAVPDTQHAFVLDQLCCRLDHAVLVLRSRWRRGRRMDLLCATQRCSQLYRGGLGTEPLVHKHHRARYRFADGID